MRLKIENRFKFQIRIVKIFLILILIGCQNSKNKTHSEKNNHSEKSSHSKKNNPSEKYFYLAKDEYAIKNSEGNVLLHLSEEDSIFIKPEKVCSLHLYPNWEKKEFPKEVFEFPNLKFLWVAMRDFKALPNEIVQLKQLEHLDLQHSGIKRLSDNFGELKNLKELTLLFSNIETLPQSICELSNLKTLHLGATKIKKLPSCLNELKNLEEFILFNPDESEVSGELRLQIKSLQKQLKNCSFGLN